MNIDSIGQSELFVDAEFSTVGAATPFSERLKSEFESVGSKLAVAETALQDLAAGKPGNIHHVMLALEDARLSFQLLAQVRNKVLEAYQDLLRMQI